MKPRTPISLIPEAYLEPIQQGALAYEWKGVRCVKNPFDLALYLRLLWQVKPGTLIEIGSYSGGSAAWFADMTGAMGLRTKIISIDIEPPTGVAFPRVEFRYGSASALHETLSDAEMATLSRPLLVVEDSSHLYEDSLAVLRFFDAWLVPGEYICVEDGIVDSFNVQERYNGGPNRAIAHFLAESGGCYEVDESYCDYFGYNVTWNTNGFLKRKAAVAKASPEKWEIAAWAESSNAQIVAAREISMLAPPALALLQALARESEGPVLEFGPYVGGSTIAIASGARSGVVSVEIGGANPDHAQIPTGNIVAQLNANLERAGLKDRVQVIEGHFRAASVGAQVSDALNGARAGMIFVDIDPGAELALCTYAKFIADHAFVVIDDYESTVAVEKAAQVKAFVSAAVERGVLEEFGVFGWGTWFGRLTGASARLGELADLLPLPCVREAGRCWQVFAGRAGESDERNGSNSPVRLAEDGCLLGPAHCLHDEIRALGGGRFSHWDGKLWFSTSDESDPRVNGRRYTLIAGEDLIDLAAPVFLPD